MSQTIQTRASIFGDMTIRDCLRVLERKREQQRAQELSLCSAQATGVEDRAVDLLLEDLARPYVVPMAEREPEMPERWDGLS